MRRLVAVLVLALGAVLPAHAAVEYHTTTGMATMSDGVHLEYTLVTPGNVPVPPGGFPLIVRQHGGGSNMTSGYDRTYGLKYVDTGNFALLMYSHRGHGASEGIFDFFGQRSTLDFSEMLDWIEGLDVGEEVDTNNVGASGYSQGGGASLLPAMHDPRIKAVGVGQTFDDLNHALNPGDCFKFSFATGIFALAYKTSASKTDDLTAIRWGAQWDTDTEDVAIPYVDALGNAGVISTTDDAASRSPATHVDGGPPGSFYEHGLHVPTFWSQSWEDALFPADHGLGILANLEADGVPTHYWFASGGHETREENAATVEAKEAAMLDWFDEFLRGVDHGFASGVRPKVDYAQRIPGGWKHKSAASWPVSSETERFWVDGRPVPNDGVLVRESTQQPGPGGPPAQPVLIVNDVAAANAGTEPILSNRAGGPMPEEWAMIPDGANRLDTALFRSGPLASPLESTGAPLFHLKYQTTAQTALQINAKLWDVAPDGTRSLVTRGCGSPRVGTFASQTFDLPLWPNSHVFPPEHHLELTVSTTDFPTFKPDVEPSLSLILPGSSLTLPGIAQ